jgi:hypothetical protein
MQLFELEFSIWIREYTNLIIKEFALVTVVITHANSAFFTHLLHVLLVIAERTNDLHQKNASLSLPALRHHQSMKCLCDFFPTIETYYFIR